MQTFENWLEERFVAEREVGGVPITKDNCEGLFSTYLEKLDGEEYLRLGDVYGKIQFLKGERKQIRARIDELEANKIK